MAEGHDDKKDEAGNEKLLREIAEELGGGVTPGAGFSRRSSLMFGLAGAGAAAALQGASPAAASTLLNGTRTPEQINEDLDKFECEKLYHRLRQARDMQDYDTFVASYYPDAIIDISWFHGTAAEFAKGTKGMFEKMNSFHEVFPSVVTLKGNRAIVSTMVVIHMLAELGGAEVDTVSYCYGRLRAERRTTEWLAASGSSIYIYDTCIPTDPTVLPKIDHERLKMFRPSYRWLSYMYDQHKFPYRDDRPGMDKPETVKALLDADKAWLNAGKS